MEKFKRYLWLSQINLFGWLTLCSFIVSSVVIKNGGVSNYGNHYSTVIFYSCAFLANIIYINLAADALLLMGRKFKYLVHYLNILCAITLAVFVSTFPRRFGVIFSDVHDKVSIALFTYEFLLALWLVYKRPTLQTIAFTFIMAAGSQVALFSAIHKIHFMFIGQMVGALGFALLLVLVFPKVISAELEKQSPKS